jgi:hypothetical protein
MLDQIGSASLVRVICVRDWVSAEHGCPQSFCFLVRKMSDKNIPAEPVEIKEPKPLSDAAKRALDEAAARRAAAEAVAERPREIMGRKGPEPTRYGDWENKGIISDF